MHYAWIIAVLATIPAVAYAQIPADPDQLGSSIMLLDGVTPFTSLSDPSDFELSHDGRHMFIINRFSSTIYQYVLDVPYDLSTAEYTSASLPVGYLHDPDRAASGYAIHAMAIEMNQNGTLLFVANRGQDTIYRYEMEPYDLSTAEYAGFYMDETFSEESPLFSGLAFDPGGIHMFATDTSRDAVHQYRLGTSYDLSNVSYVRSIDVADNIPTDIVFTPDGMRMIISADVQDGILWYNLSGTYDLAGAKYDHTLLMGDIGISPRGMHLGPEGDRLFILTSAIAPTPVGVYEYDLSPPAGGGFGISGGPTNGGSGPSGPPDSGDGDFGISGTGDRTAEVQRIAASGGGFKTTSVLAPHLVEYDMCGHDGGTVRVLAFNAPHVEKIQVNLYSGDHVSFGTRMSDGASYLTRSGGDSREYSVWEASLPPDIRKFFVTTVDLADSRTATSTLIHAGECSGRAEPHPVMAGSSISR